MSDTNPGEAGWQADPTGKHDHRYWDGSQWTDNVSDAGVASTDAYAAAGPPAGDAASVDPASTDPTVTAPVAMTPPDPTSSFSAGGPPPPTAPVPAAAAADGGSGGSKRGLLIGGGILLIVAIIVAALALSGGDDKDDSDALHAKLAAEFGDGLSDKDADCVASYLVDNVDHDTLAGLDYSSTDVPAEIQADTVKALAECNISVGDVTTTTGSSDDSTTTTESSGDETTTTGALGGAIPDAVRNALQTSLEQAGLSSDQAECVTDKMVDAYQSGDISASDFTTKYLDFFSDCNVDPSSFGN